MYGSSTYSSSTYGSSGGGDSVFIFQSSGNIGVTGRSSFKTPLGKMVSTGNIGITGVGHFQGYESPGTARYGRGTVLNPDVTATRSDLILYLTTLAVGSAANSTPLTTDGVRLRDSNFSNGSDAAVGVCSGGGVNRIYQRSSSNFTSWGSEVEIPSSNLPVARARRNPSILEDAAGKLWLTFDYVESIDNYGHELRNIYYQTSDDHGVTWSTATKLTTYDSVGSIGRHPTWVQIDSDTLRLLYNQVSGAIRMYPNSSLHGSHWSFNSLNRKMYYAAYDTVYEVDIDTGVTTNYWNTTTVPGMIQGRGYTGCDGIEIGIDNIPVILNDSSFGISVVHPSSDTITHYIFRTDNAAGILQNVNWDDNDSNVLGSILHIYVDETNSRLYICWGKEHSLAYDVHVGYFDLTDVTTPYTFTLIVHEHNSDSAPWNGYKFWRILPEEGLIICAGGEDWHHTTFLSVWDLTTGARTQHWYGGNNESMPYHGLRGYGVYKNGYYYTAFNYLNDDVRQSDHRGLCIINVATGVISYSRPTVATLDEYNMWDVIEGPNNTLLISTRGDSLSIMGTSSPTGVLQYDIISDTWSVYNSSNVPGLLDATGNSNTYLTYVPSEDLLLIACGDSYGAHTASYIFSPSGAFRQARYFEATYSGSVWTFENKGLLIQSLTSHSATACVPSAGSGIGSYIFWQYDIPSTGSSSIYWDLESTGFALLPYLMREEEISITRSIDGNPNELTFRCSHGHLFDPHNLSSLLSPILKKGRKLVVRWGELINGTEYWQNAGTFYITATNLKFKKGVYTSISVTAEDERVIWKDRYVFATDEYNTYPETIIADILESFADLLSSDINLPTFVTRTLLEHQWVDMTIEEILEKICDRYGYVMKMDVYGKVSAIRISELNAVSHAYSDLSTIIEYEPDDSYSDFTNRVTVIGCEKDYTDVTYPEEKVGSMSGTIGWWGAKKTHEIKYSADGDKTCINPRLDVLESTAGIGFAIGGGMSESITAVDPNHTWCEVTIEGPDLRPALGVALAALVGSLYIPDTCNIPIGNTQTIRVGSLATAISANAALIILASVGNYQFDIYAIPTGRIRRTVQATANDTVLQNEIGVINTKKIEEPLAYTVGECQFVADQEMMISRLQRQRIKITKLAHLQDEEGDIIQFKHPYSGSDMKNLINKITRSLKMPEGEDEEGYFLDKIEGWVVR